jgi:hypothetical protein
VRERLAELEAHQAAILANANLDHENAEKPR